MNDNLASDPTPEMPEPDRADEVASVESLERGHFLEKIRFSWRTEDESILAKIEAEAADMCTEMFSKAIAEVDRFYEYLRVPLYRNGARVVDTQGRQVWKMEDNKLVEAWDQLTGQDIEEILMNLQRIKLYLSLDVNKLKNHAVYAKMVGDDQKDDNWGKVMQGTQGDRAARANRESRVDRYHAYFRYYLWSTAEALDKEISQFMRRLEKIRDWRIWDNRG